MRRLSALVLGLAAAALLGLWSNTSFTAQPVQAAQTWTVDAGGGSDSNPDLDANAFLPKALTINAGDTVNWIIKGFHTVTFPAGQPVPPLVVPGPGAGELSFSSIFFPVGPPSPAVFTGREMVSSGTPEEGVDDPPPFTLTFPNPGVYNYLCAIHPGQEGWITVVPANAGLPETPAQAMARGQAELRGMEQALQAMLPMIQPSHTMGAGGRATHGLAAGVSNASGMSALAFVPADIAVRRGDTIVWAVADPLEIHTVTFLSGTPQPPLNDVRPQPNGPPLIVFPANVAGPVGGSTYRGTGYFNSGLLGPGSTYGLTIDAPAGTYEYLCLLHASADSPGGMKGRIIVSE